MSTKIQLSSKKRRVVSKSGESSTSSSPRQSKRTKTSSERVASYDEERETETQSINDDLQLNKETCAKIQSLFKEIKTLKESGRSENAATIAEKRAAASVLFVTLKKMNRLSQLRCKKARDMTQTTKQKVDGLHLQLQNHSMKSSDEKIELVDVATFYREAPLDISMPSVTEKDPHKQRLARLDWELEQRKRLSEKYDASESNRDLVAREIKSKQEYLESLQPRLKSILEGNLPIAKPHCFKCHHLYPLGHSTGKAWKGLKVFVKQVTSFLLFRFKNISRCPTIRSEPNTRWPDSSLGPLYILFVQSSAYSEACDGDLTVKIEGDSDTASASMSTSVAIEEDSDSDNEDNLTESKRRRKTVGDKLEEKRKKALAKHPLQVVMQLTFQGEAQLVLTFSYLIELQVVTVVTELKDSSAAKALQSDLLSPKTILNALYPGDDGAESPNPSNIFQLQRIGVSWESVSMVPVVVRSRLSQCDELKMKPNTCLSSSHMEATVKALKGRIKARLALQKQVTLVGQGNIPVPSSTVKLFPSKLSSRVVSWKPITEEAMMELDFVLTHPLSENIDSSSFFYSFSCERKSAKVQGVVVLKEAYPITPPIFLIKLIWQNKTHMAASDHDILDMEAEVNLHSQELITAKTCEYLLSCQLQRLLQCLDVYLEAASAEEASRSPGTQVEFPKEKMFVRNTRLEIVKRSSKWNN
ncbi:putative THO complex subunit 5-like A isoform X2 [Apostichopus japonicus]|uniref:Putative THO complex subunit 5-like A isoform X2 n=1 Tax=Stichopus japonicus TaxID=307972 RepID=A0A2G8L0R8_STIJA|nr:putative THO complex subunit 5-like A isoform X2 [Apostichopus japonicus]